MAEKSAIPFFIDGQNLTIDNGENNNPVLRSKQMELLDSQLLVQTGLSFLAFLIYLVTLSFTNSAVLKYGSQQKIIEKRIVYIKKLLRLLLLLVFFVSLAVIWGIDFKGILILTSSLFAVVGISLFASWSILSNFTSGIILLFSFPHKIGDRIKVIDGDNSVEGKIIDMTIFSIQIEDENKNIISYPNNLAMQKPIMKINPGE